MYFETRRPDFPHVNLNAESRADPRGGEIGAIAPLKLTKVSLFAMILYNLENRIRDLRPFAVNCFVTAVL